MSSFGNQDEDDFLNIEQDLPVLIWHEVCVNVSIDLFFTGYLEHGYEPHLGGRDMVHRCVQR